MYIYINKCCRGLEPSYRAAFCHLVGLHDHYSVHVGGMYMYSRESDGSDRSAFSDFGKWENALS